MVVQDTKATPRTAQLMARLPAFSPVALKLMAIISDENVSFKQVTELIKLDPALAGEVLSLANSGLYGRRFPVRTITHAMALVGIRKVGSIVITAALWKALPRRGSPFIQGWWRHAVASALVADHVCSGQSIDSSYTAGLLHSIGQLALFQYSPEQYAEGLKYCCSTGSDLMEHERDAFGIDHASLGDAILHKWGLAEDLQEAAAWHHHDDFRSASELPNVVQIACFAAESAGFGACGCHHRISTGDIPKPVQRLIDTRYLLEVLPQEVNGIECSLT